MKQIVYYSLGLVSAISVLIGCSRHPDGNGLKTVFVEKNFEKADFDDFSSKIEVLEVFRPEFTDSTMFVVPDILAIADGKAYLHEGKWLAVYDYPSGSLVGAFNRYGAGPGEYKYSYYAYYTGNEWTVLDHNIGRYNIIQYAPDGEYLRTIRNDTVQSLSPIADGGWLAFNDTMDYKDGYRKVREKKVYQYTSDWNLSDTYVLKERRWADMGSDRMDQVYSFNGVQYVVDTDTIYSIDTDTREVTPRIAMALGRYACDWGSFEDGQEVQEAEKSHFDILGPIFNSRYLFARYTIYFDSPWVVYYDVYDLDNGDLVYRHRLNLEGQYGMCQYYEGIPVELDGKTVYGWPIEYVENDEFYVVIAGDEMARISDSDEVNPVFVKIRIED